MKKLLFGLFILLCVVICIFIMRENISAYDDEMSSYSNKILHVDPVQIKMEELYFETTERDHAASDRFTLVNYTTMSNARGERWALVTIKNNNSAARSITGEEIVAIFANGEQAYARMVKASIGSRDLLSKAVYFGLHKFPVARIEVRQGT